MAKFEKFKLPKVWERVQDNENKINNLETITIRNKDIAFNKRKREIILLQDQYVDPNNFFLNPLSVNAEFEELPEWALPFLHPYHVFTTTGGFEVNIFLFSSTHYLWKKVGGNHVLKYIVRAILGTGTPGEFAPLFVTVKVAVLNDFVWHEIQQLKD